MKKQNRFSGFFGYEGGFSYYAGKLFDIMAVSLFWLLGSLFIVTAGTSFSALYAAASRSIRQDAEPFSSRFLKSYGQNLKTGIPLWLLFLGGVFLLLLNMGILLKKMNTVFGWFFIVLYGAVILIAIMAASYAFPALSRFEMPTGWFVKLSLYLTFRHIGISLLLLLIFAASYLLLLWQPLLAAFVPGAANVLISKLIDPILDQHMPKKEG